jgi:hypothetical protein
MNQRVAAGGNWLNNGPTYSASVCRVALATFAACAFVRALKTTCRRRCSPNTMPSALRPG